MFRDLREFIAVLEAKGDLVRITAEVDPDQEITIIQHKVLAAGGPALLFENVKGSPYRLVSNLYGTPERVQLVFGDRKPSEIGEELASLILGELCQQRFQDLCQKLGSTRKRGAALTSLLLVRTQYLAPLLDDVDILTGSDAIECLQNPECLAKVRPKDIPSPLLRNVEDRIQGLRGPRGQQSGAVSRHRQQGLEMLAEDIWQAYEALIPTVLGVPKPPVPEIPPPSPDDWKSRFAQRLQRMRQAASLPEPSLPPQPQPLLPDTEPEAALAEEAPPIQEATLPQGKPPEYPEKDLAAEVTSRLRERVPFQRVDHLVPRPALIAWVKELLLAEAGPSLIGLWGTAGVGKTALLQMLWLDPDVQRLFEFLLWADLGLEADESLDAKQAKQHLREQLSLWADALSLPAANLSTVEQLSSAIQECLQDRRVLIFLDDAWSGDSIQPLLVGSKAIITSKAVLPVRGINTIVAHLAPADTLARLVHFIITRKMIPTTPMVPTRLSLMIANTLSLGLALRNPSHVSANPSKWRAPLALASKATTKMVAT